MIRYAAYRFEAAGVEFRPSRMSRLIREAGPEMSKQRIDSYFAADVVDLVVNTSTATGDDRALRILTRTWRGFEMYFNGYRDPTAAQAIERLTLIDRRSGLISGGYKC